MNNIAIYASTMGAGKSTVAKYLVEQYGYVQLKFAATLKEMLVVFLSKFVDDPWEYLEGDKKENVVPELDITTRYLMQTLGSEWGRNLLGENTWVKVVTSQIKPFQLYVIDDLRFENEYNKLKEMGFVMIKLVGYGKLTQVHASEGSLDNFNFDHVISNDGTIEDLYNKVDIILNGE